MDGRRTVADCRRTIVDCRRTAVVCRKTATDRRRSAAAWTVFLRYALGRGDFNGVFCYNSPIVSYGSSPVRMEFGRIARQGGALYAGTAEGVVEWDRFRRYLVIRGGSIKTNELGGRPQ